MHETTCANSQIDYWFVHPTEKESVAVGSQCHENLSDHVEVDLHTDIILINILGDNPEGKILTHSGKDHIKPKVRWDKCDLQLYSDILQAGLQKTEANSPFTLLEIDLTAMALNKLLYDASLASTPKKLNGARKKSRLPVWNDTIAAAVRLSKLAHTEWKEAGSPTIATDLPLIKKKAARWATRQTIRQKNYLQMQEKYTELMLAKEMDTKYSINWSSNRDPLRTLPRKCYILKTKPSLLQRGLQRPFLIIFRNWQLLLRGRCLMRIIPTRSLLINS